MEAILLLVFLAVELVVTAGTNQEEASCVSRWATRASDGCEL
jgi:hypothetical protein